MSLIIFAWPPCSWKTTYLNKYNNYKIVSSDNEISLLNKKKYTQNELNILWIKNSYKKINDYIDDWNEDIVYDSTNLTVSRREQVLYKINTNNTEVVNFISDFNSIYLNWKKRWEDINIEMLLYLFIIFKKVNISEWFSSICKVENKQLNNFSCLKEFLEWKVFDKNEILEENKELKVLDEFWKKWNKDFFEEYKNKLEYLDEMTLEDRLALLYSDIIYFYIDFIDIIDITYKVDYEDFLEGFLENILSYKIEKMNLDTKSTFKSFKKLINTF